MEYDIYNKFVTFFNGDDENIIDIYNTTNSDFIRRIDPCGNAYCQWDLKDYNNEYIKSGIYSYRVGADTTGGGQLTGFKDGYVAIILRDD